MKKHSIGSLAVVSVFVFLVLILAAGCSDDDPVTPAPLPEATALAVTPDSLMSMWQSALVDMDSTMYEGMYHSEFRYIFSPGDQSAFRLITDHMTRKETIGCGWAMFSGESVQNWRGQYHAAVTRISIPQMTRETTWEIVDPTGKYPGASHARFTMQMQVERGFGLITLAAAGSYDFYAVEMDTLLADGTAGKCFKWVALEGLDPDKELPGLKTWGSVNFSYMTNEDPQALFTVSDIGGSPLPVWSCDASGSSDSDSGLHPQPYRWRFEEDGEWTEWSADPVAAHSYSTLGNMGIALMVRDRWGAPDNQEQEVQVGISNLPFPGSPDQLMANFQTIYESRDLLEYLILMDPEFRTVLQEQTTMEFPDVGTTLDYAEESRIHERMFSGEAVTDPYGDLIPGVNGIYFSKFRALDAWAVAPTDGLFPNTEYAMYEVEVLLDRGQTYSTLKVNGMINFHVASRDTVYQGENGKFYQMAGQVDLTNLNKGVEGLAWGSVKALWR